MPEYYTEHFDLEKRKYKPEIFLATPQKQIITKLYDASHIRSTIKLGRVNELSFNIPYDVESENNIYDITEGITLTRNDVIDQIKDRFLIKYKLGDFEEWYIIKEQDDEADDEKDYRVVNCYSLNYELKNIKIIQYNVVSYTILEILKGKPFDEVPGILVDSLWAVGHVDDELLDKYRAYDCTIKNGLDILNELAEIFDCIAIFDTENRLINLYDMDNVGENKGLKIDYGKYLKRLTHKSESDEVVTRLKVYGRDSLTIRRINPVGTDYIEDYTYFMYPFEYEYDEHDNIYTTQSSDYMSDELCEAITLHRKKINEYSPTFTSLIGKLELLNQLLIAKNVELRNMQNELIQLRDNLRIAEKARSGGTTVQFFQSKIDKKEQEIEKQREHIEKLESDMKGVNVEIDTIKRELSEKNNYTASLLEEKRYFTYEDDFIKNSIVEEHELYRAASDYFSEVNRPKISVSIDIVDFLDILEEQGNWDKLILGDIIKVKYDKFDVDISVRIVEINYDFENENISLVITNVKDFVFTDEVDALARLLHRNINMVKAVDVSRVRWDGIDRLSQSLEDILANPWETLGLEDDVDWEIEERIDRLYDEMEEIIIPEIELPDFDARFAGMYSSLLTDFENMFANIEFPEPEEPTEITVDTYMEYIETDWNSSGFEFNYVQEYEEEPNITMGLQGENVENELNAYSFALVAEHILNEEYNYIGAKIFPQGTGIPGNNDFSGKITVHAICTGLVDEYS